MTCLRKYRLLRLISSHVRSYKNFPRSSHHARYSTKADITLMEYLQARIKATGPITVADYMKAVLTSTDFGYYMYKDMFGSKGDFITSPEISQMFGEMIGVWCINEWTNLCQGKDIQIVEFGPGRGTLAEDMLRVFSQFPDFSKHVSLHLVEISPALSLLQRARLTNTSKPVDLSYFDKQEAYAGLGPYQQGVSKYGHPISWYRSLDDVPKGLSFFLGHEFLDALPVYKFQKTERGWFEVLVDITEGCGGPVLRFVQSPVHTPAYRAYLRVDCDDKRNHIEVCPAAAQIIQEVSTRILHHGGFALFADYGHTGEKGDTFRAFRQHKLHDPLVDPGSADLTADVDFSYLQRYARDVATFGPITQQKFLLNMGIGVRLQMLLEKTHQEYWKSLVSGYDMLTNPKKMGERFKFFAIIPPLPADYVPAGFVTPDFLQEQKDTKDPQSLKDSQSLNNQASLKGSKDQTERKDLTGQADQKDPIYLKGQTEQKAEQRGPKYLKDQAEQKDPIHLKDWTEQKVEQRGPRYLKDQAEQKAELRGLNYLKDQTEQKDPIYLKDWTEQKAEQKGPKYLKDQTEQKDILCLKDQTEHKDSTYMKDQTEQKDPLCLKDQTEHKDSTYMKDQTEHKDSKYMKDQIEQRDLKSLKDQAQQNDPKYMMGLKDLFLTVLRGPKDQADPKSLTEQAKQKGPKYMTGLTDLFLTILRGPKDQANSKRLTEQAKQKDPKYLSGLTDLFLIILRGPKDQKSLTSPKDQAYINDLRYKTCPKCQEDLKDQAGVKILKDQKSLTDVKATKDLKCQKHFKDQTDLKDQNKTD